MENVRNKVQLAGNLGLVPEIRTTATGRRMARMSLATHERYKNAQGEWVQQTYWHNLIAWGKIAEQVEKELTKGAQVMVEGKLVYREYTDRAGVKRQVAEVLVLQLQKLEKPEPAPAG